MCFHGPQNTVLSSSRMLLVMKFESRESTSLLSTFILQVDLILDREGNEGLDRDVGTYVQE